MKQSLLLILATLLFASLEAQNTVKLNIHHKLGDADFAMGMAVQNNLGNEFELTRMEYYISGITITHDGVDTTIRDLWFLINADEPTVAELGQFDFDMVEKIGFHIGVDSIHNHSDPAAYPAGHPLAPKSPSMHWGWAAGYRFVALEGNAGNNFSQEVQLHGLLDKNYFEAEVEVIAEADNGEINIYVDADYTRAVEDIVLTSGVINHGGTGTAKKCLENFRDFVFSAGADASATIDFSEVDDFMVYPNPAPRGNVNVHVMAPANNQYQVSVADILGRPVLYLNSVYGNTNTDVQLNHQGLYLINLIKEGYPVITQKLIVE